jgi:hypothetical protein
MNRALDSAPPSAAVSFDAFIEAAWADHAEAPDAVATRLEQSLAIVTAPAQVPAYARLVTHVFGEHLGQWQRGIALHAALLGAAVGDDGAAGSAAIARGIATLRFCGGDAQALAGMALDDRIIVLATAASALAGQQRFAPAVDAYEQALALARPGLPAESAAPRALAACGNNLASALEGKRDRDDAETAGMVAAAEGALQYWKIAGTWLEEERAEYRLARSRLEAGDHDGALRSATNCLRVCTEHYAPPFELFFAHAARTLALRAAGDTAASAAERQLALRQYSLVAPDEQAWCKSDLEELGNA